MSETALTFEPEGDAYNLGLDPAKDLRLEFIQVNGQLGIFTYGRNRTEGEKTVRMVLLLKMPPSRALFRKGVLGVPLCTSDNGLMPINAEQAAQIKAGPTCANCQFGQWYGKKPPACGENLNMLVATHPRDTNGEPYPSILRLRGTSIPIMQDLLTALERTRRGEVLSNGSPTPPFGYFIFAELEHISRPGTSEADPGQNFYRLKAKIDGKTDRAHWQQYAMLFDMTKAKAAQILSYSSEAERIATAEEEQRLGPIAEQTVTPAQANFILSLLAELPPEVSAATPDPTHLNRQEASQLIDALKARQQRQRSAAQAQSLAETPVGEPDILPFSTDEPWEPPFPALFIDAEHINAIEQAAAAQFISETELARWLKSLYKLENVAGLTVTQADEFLSKLAVRAASIAKSPQATAVQQRHAAKVTTAPTETVAAAFAKRGRPAKS